MASASADTARLFFAAWPASEIQHALNAVALGLRPACGGRAVPQRNIHLTLAFLGNVERQRLQEIEAIAAGTGCSACELRVERLEYWRHNRIVWAGVAQCPGELQGLVARLAGALRAAGFKLDSRPYVPHVTLLRDARRAPVHGTFAAIAWPVREFVLVESRPRGGAREYSVLRRWQCEG